MRRLSPRPLTRPASVGLLRKAGTTPYARAMSRFLPLASLLALVAASSSAQSTAAAKGLNVTALTPTILRIPLATPGPSAENSSWAVSAAVRAQRAPVTPTADGFTTDALQVAIDQKTGALTLRDRSSRTILAGLSLQRTAGQTVFTLRAPMPAGERYVGLGDKTGGLDRRGSSFVNWNTDAYGFGTATDPIYKSIPFFIAVGKDGAAYGVFLDDPQRSWFDFGHREENVLTIGADAGPADLYLIAGPTVADVVRRYTDLTGKAPLPPRWALGYQQSRYSYMSEAELRTVAGRLRSEHIPTDVLWLDIDFQDRNRPFTVNRTTFPDMKRLTADLGKDGFKLITITDLHIAHAPNQSYSPYDSGVAGDHFLKNPDGSTYVAPVWPGPSVFPDFTRASTRRWWGDLYRPFLDDGVAGFWNDMNEPAIFDTPTKTMPLDTRHRIDSDDFAARTATHAEIHNVYGMENSRATYEGLLRLRPNSRPFVMTRASYAGGQRYAVTWTGDNSASWDHLRLMVQQLLNLGLSGFSWAGADIGGFTGGPSPELLTRFTQIGAFTPIFRNHSAKDTPRVEPWLDGPQQLAIRRRFIEERYRLLPYFYAVAEQNSRTGDPVMRPLFYDFSKALTAPCDQSMSFTVGRDLLVAASPKPESPQAYDICLPGGGWYDYWTGKRVPADKISETPALERLPVFVRPGAILPRQPLTQSTAEVPSGPLELHVYPGPDCAGTLYWDDGTSLDYRRRAFLRQAIRCSADASGLRLTFAPRDGSYRPWWRELAVTVHGWTGASRVEGAGRPIAATADGPGEALRFILPDQSRGGEVVIRRQ
ncbi:DUF5110 domain-containing protein [Sphingomonas sp. KRR8]|uniref:glycoside hydrolase family 31 protein n=1 Tax=Sphingomonas sp. KRR8 TaxID=2942996 RepID=UPI002020CD35|nr:TIM-barrel domain-containing protein [Sphingomonas sp. KRR8]URD60930.1 DUF5110 domain-containing protein [Sphingomonas sp. KRR8]